MKTEELQRTVVQRKLHGLRFIILQSMPLSTRPRSNAHLDLTDWPNDFIDRRRGTATRNFKRKNACLQPRYDSRTLYFVKNTERTRTSRGPLS